MDVNTENVEYRVEIKKCEQVQGSTEVMYVLDFGGADIPENLAMSIAKMAADGSMSLGDGLNSFIVQNADTVTEQAQIMQVETGEEIQAVESASLQHVIEIDTDPGADCVLDTPNINVNNSIASTNATTENATAMEIGQPNILNNISNESIQVYMSVTNTGKQTESNPSPNVVILEENQSLGKVKSSSSLMQSSMIHVDNSRRNKRLLMPNVVAENDLNMKKKTGENVSVLTQTPNSLNTINSISTSFNRSGNTSEGNNKPVDRLPITPFLNGKTPVMLLVKEDGDISTDVSSVPSLMKIEKPKRVTSLLGKKFTDTLKKNIDQQIPFTEKKGTSLSTPKPMVIDFNAEKLRLSQEDKVLNADNADEETKAEEKELHENLQSQVTMSAHDSQVENYDNDVVENLEAEDGDKRNVGENEMNETFNGELVMTVSGNSSKQHEETPTSNPAESLMEDGVEEAKERKCFYEDCTFTADDQEMFSHHLITDHNDPKPFCCFVCCKRFKVHLSLTIHDLIHKKDARPTRRRRGPYGTRKKSYTCPLCEELCKYKKDIKVHIQDKHCIDRVFTCESCKFICLDAEQLDEHVATVIHRTDNRDYCDICEKWFTNVGQHKATVHSDDRPFECDQCDYKAKSKSSLRYHLVTHLTSKDFQCPHCDYKTATERRLKRHMKIHDPDKKFTCELCPFSTHDSYEYKRHHKNTHSKGPKVFKCKFCSQTFDKHHEIRLHLMFEHDCNDAFFCNQCDFACASRAEYKEHIQTHTGKNQHVCHICGFAGKFKTHYRRHMLTHSKAKPFECKICFKRLSEASNLRRHMLTHSEEKPLACSVCGYRCKIRSRLMNHMKTHSELRPFACHLCKYTTKFNGNLMKHLENHAKYKPHKCQYCFYSCNEKNKLKRHMNFRHRDLLESSASIIRHDNIATIKTENELSEVHLDGKEMIAVESTNEILLVPKDEVVMVQEEEEQNIVVPMDECSILVSKQNIFAQLETGNVILTVDSNEAPTAVDGNITEVILNQ